VLFYNSKNGNVTFCFNSFNLENFN
jgi:hypothetical protein